MSAHLLRTRTAESPARDVLVQTGWSEKEGRFYLLIRELPEGQDGPAGKVLFTSGGQRVATAEGRDFSRFLVVLGEMAIRLPSEMLSAVILDSQGDARERGVTWLASGKRAGVQVPAEQFAESS